MQSKKCFRIDINPIPLQCKTAVHSANATFVTVFLLYTVLAKPLTIILFPNTVEHVLNMSRDQKIAPSDDFNPLQCKIEV